VTERPILMSGPLVRSTLKDRKTQTRRLLRVQPDRWEAARDESAIVACPDGVWVLTVGGVVRQSLGKCPYGAPGDRLWVRETWALVQRGDCAPGGWPYDPYRLYRATDDEPDLPDWALAEPFRWRPSIHMPRWASRLTLEVTGVRVERLRAITQADAVAEGMPDSRDLWCMPASSLSDTSLAGPRAAFATVWDSLKPKPGAAWADNPWVWVIEFRRAA